MKRILSLAVALLLALSVFGFANGETENAAISPYGAYDELTTVSIAKRVHSDLNFIDSEDTQENNAMTRFIKQALNLEVKIAWESDDFSNKLALEFASGTLPEMFVLGPEDYLLYRQLVDNEMLYNLGSIYDACAGDYLKYVNGTYDNRTITTFTEPDGAMYCIAGGNYDYNGHPQLFLRQDWLDNLGLGVPSTIDELENVLRAFKENYNSVGLLLNATDPMAGWNYMYNANAIAEFYGAHPYSWVYAEDGSVVYGSTQEGMKDALALLAKWYAEGLIDAEFATRDSSANTALFTSGQAGACYGPWWSCYSFSDFNEVEGAQIAIANCPLGADGNYSVIGAPSSANIMCVRADSEHPEAAYKLLNICFESYRGFNKEGYAAIAPEVEHGCDWEGMLPTDVMNLEKASALQSAADAANEMINNGAIADETVYTSYELSVAKSAAEFKAGTATTANDWINYYARYIASNMFGNLNVTYPAFSFTTESMSDMWPSLQSLEQTTFLQIITGEKSVDDFDAFVEQWYQQGGAMVTDEVNAIVVG